MADDGKVLVTESYLSAIGNAIREKNGETVKYKPSQMAAAISGLTTGIALSAADEGKVVVDGVLVGQVEMTVAANGIYDTTVVSSITVSVPNVTINLSSEYTETYAGNELSVTGLAIEPMRFMSDASITTVEGNGIIAIGTEAFRQCTALSSVNFPACYMIANSCFSGCSNLVTVNFPTCADVGEMGFADCSALESVTLPSCTVLERYVFRSCTNLSVGSFPACETIRAYAFRGCTALTDIYLGYSEKLVSLNVSQAFVSPYPSIHVPIEWAASYRSAYGAYSELFVGDIV